MREDRTKHRFLAAAKRQPCWTARTLFPLCFWLVACDAYGPARPPRPPAPAPQPLPPREAAEAAPASTKPCIPSKEPLPDVRKELSRAIDKLKSTTPECVRRAIDYEPGSLQVALYFETPCQVEGLWITGRARMAITGADEKGGAQGCLELEDMSAESAKATRDLLGKLNSR